MEKEKDNLRVGTDELWEKNKEKWFNNLDPEVKKILLESDHKKKVANITPPQKYDAISQALKKEDTPESDKIVLKAALKELESLILREKKIGSIGDRYPDSVVAFRILGIVALLIGLFILIQGAVWIGIVIILFSISFLSSTRKKLPR